MANLPTYLSIFLDKCNPSKQLVHVCLSALVLVVSSSFTLNASANQNDSDGDGLSDVYELKIGSESYLSDTDGDAVKDGDEIGDKQDSPRDSDNDGVIDVLDYDDDNDGLPTYLESKNDSDKDGLLDYLDKDSDNDGIPDGEESGFLNQDKNQDGIDDAFDIGREGAVDNNGDGIDDNVKLPDHNNDGKPDYLDGKFQRLKQILVKNKNNKPTQAKTDKKPTLDKLADNSPKLKKEKIVDETKVTNPKQASSHKPDDMVINRHTDSDNDGLSNALEKRLGTNHLSRDSDDDKVSDAIEIGLDVNSPQDSDHDGIIDALDNDDDNDGVLTKFEDLNNDSTAINDDTDGDGVPNYLDANDDGDDLLTKAEGLVLDSDGDGILDYLDKNNNVKDASNSSNQIVKTKDDKTPAEPEIVVLFDGDAATLTEDDEISLDQAEDGNTQDSVQDSVLTSLDNMLENNDLSGVNKTDDSSNGKINTSSSSNKSAVSHWNLF